MKSAGDFKIELYAGVIRNSFPTSFDAPYASSVKLDPSFSPSGGINFVYSLPGNFKAFSVGLSLGYEGYNQEYHHSGFYYLPEAANLTYTINYDETISLKRSMMMSNIYAMWIFNPLSNIKVFLKAGLGYHFSIGNNTDLVSTDTGSIKGAVYGPTPYGPPLNTTTTIYSFKNSYIAPNFATGIITGRSKFEFVYWLPVHVSYPLSGNSQSAGTYFTYGAMGIFYYYSLFRSK